MLTIEVDQPGRVLRLIGNITLSEELVSSYVTLTHIAETYQPLDAELTALAGLTSAANKLPYFTGTDTAALTNLTPFARSILDDADAASVRTTIGAGTGAGDVVGPSSAMSNCIARFDGPTGKLIQQSSVIVNDDGTIVTLGGVVAFGSVTGGSLRIKSSSPSTAHHLVLATSEAITAERTLTLIVGNANRTLTLGGNTTLNGGVHSGTNTGDQDLSSYATTAAVAAGYQPLHANLTAIAGLTSAANKLAYFTGSGTAALTDLSAFARTILDDADAAAVRATIGAAASAGAGDVAGPSSATDNAIARYDGTTGKLIQDSLAAINDAGHLTAPDISAFGGGSYGNVFCRGLSLTDPTNSTPNYVVAITRAGSQTGHHGLEIDVNDGDRAISLAGDLTVPATITLGTGAALTKDTDNTLAADSDDRVATQKAVKAHVASVVAALDALVFQGVLDCSANPNYPAADTGDIYRVSVAGKIGGGSGPNVEVGDLLLCLADGTASGSHATVGSSWNISQVNIDGAVVGPTSATDGAFALFDGTSGRLIKNSAYSPSSFQGADATLTALAAYNTNGLVCQTAADTFAGRTITGTANQVTVTNGNGVSGNPTLSLPQDIHTGASPQFTAINLGHASDTAITRVGIGHIAVGGVSIVTTGAQQTLVNKTLTDPSLTRLIEANTAGSGSPNVLIAAESYRVLTNEGTTAENYHTLPTAAAGLVFSFTCQDANGIRITAASGDTIRYAQTVSATAGYIRSSVIGSTVTLEAINATEWIATAWTGHWAIDATTADTTNYGYATLGSAYNFPGATANSVAVEPGLSVVLPGAGKWRLKFALNAVINFSAGSSGRLYGYLYNVTASAVITGTTSELVFWPTTGAYATDMRYTEVVVSVSVATTVRVEVYSSGGTTWTTRAIDSPGTFLGFERVP